MPASPSHSRSMAKSKPTAIVASTNASSAKSDKSIQLSPSRLPVKPTRSSSRLQNSVENLPQSRLFRNNTSSANAANSKSNNDTERPSVAGLRRSASSCRVKAPSIEPNPGKRDRSTPLVTASRHSRHNSAKSSSVNTRDSSHGRIRSSSTLTSTSNTRPLTRGSITVDAAIRAPLLAPDIQTLKKPKFSTHQQHYSPVKNPAPKLHPAAFLAPPTPSKWPSNKAISAEISKLQNELLQLHLLHKDAATVEKEWRASAKNKISARFKKVVEMESSIREAEKHENAKLNSIALKEWQEVGVPGWGLDEKIQVLDDILTEVLNIGDTGGKYSRVVRTFKKWLESCQDVLSYRARKDESNLEGLFLEDLESTWKDDCFSLYRKLGVWNENLRDLGMPQCQSSLVMMINWIQIIISGMLLELGLMAQMEEEVMKMERQWIKNMTEELTDEEVEDRQAAGAIWRSVPMTSKT
ncbi:hypothetical protein GcM3_222009 [Golovinomyces cichoracearum]|uniref:Aga1 a-agglutinin anchor subunit n=1 Tax=Golovinomyces cichoracearum TaxID=62708 RepID=A0A420H1X0_9PEZI|nr:hypothetical protein GcM3_222009 [Golovinomyces cichoracearum]